MANFNRFDDRRASYNFEKRGRSFFRPDSPLSSPLFRKKQFSFTTADASLSVPSSVASSRDSSLDRAHDSGPRSIHQVLERVRSSPKLSLRQRFQVMRTSSFSDVDGVRNNLEAKRKKWMLNRTGSIRLGRFGGSGNIDEPAGTTSMSQSSSPETERRGRIPLSPRDRSLDRVQLLERRGSYSPSHHDGQDDSGKLKGFVNRWFRHITEASNAYKARENRRSYRGNDSPSHNGLGDSDRKSEGVSTESLDLPGDKKGQPAGRSQSFHEHSVSSLEPHPERQPSSPPEDRAEADSFASKTGGDESATSQRKRLQRVEILKIAEPCPLIDPSQVVVTQGEILVADPVLTPIEKIHRKDLEISRALQEKLNLIAEILHIPLVDFDNIVDMASQPAPDRDAREVLLAALAQAKSLTDLVNESLSLSEEATVIASTEPFRLSSPPKDVGAEPRSRLPGPPTERLVGISSSMNQHLTSLLAIIQERDDERDRLRRELQRSQEQVHALLSQSSVRTSSLSATSPTSRPASFISVEESSAADMSEKNQESEDDVTGGKSLEETDSSPPQDSTLTEDKDLDEERKVSAAGTDSDEQDQFVDAAEITQAKSETEATGDDDGEKEKEEN